MSVDLVGEPRVAHTDRAPREVAVLEVPGIAGGFHADGVRHVDPYAVHPREAARRIGLRMHGRPFEAVAVDLGLPEDRRDARRQQILERWTVLDGYCGQEVTNLCPHRRDSHRVLRKLRG